ncbi:hypothetical protein GQ57_34635 [Burkholderia sp. MSh2]|nr:hypothetical protein GQ57_34635 [Burkholderia sp. MSh2]
MSRLAMLEWRIHDPCAGTREARVRCARHAPHTPGTARFRHGAGESMQADTNRDGQRLSP